MPPKIALLLCTVFVLFLLRLERKQTPEVSRALWIPTIWMLLIASKPLAVWFPSFGGDMDSGSPLDRGFLSGLLCLCLFILTKRKFNWSSAIKEQTWLILLIGYMFVSIAWSDIPFTSLKRSTRELIAVIMAFLLLTEPSPQKAFESLFRRTVYILIPFSLLLIKYFPEYGRIYHSWSGGETWTGVAMQKNGLGRLCIISVFFLIWSHIRRRQGGGTRSVKYQSYAEVFLLIMALWLLKGATNAYPATAIMALVAALAVYIYLLRRKRRQINFATPTFSAMIAFVIVFGIVTVFAGGSTVGPFASSLGRDSTLTGRTIVWSTLLPVALEQPILGHGFGGFWTSAVKVTHDIGESHSGYLDLFLDLGFLGLLLVSIFLLSSCRKAEKSLGNDFDWASMRICYLVMAVIHNITESSINSLTTHMTAVLVFLMISSSPSASFSPGNSRK